MPGPIGLLLLPDFASIAYAGVIETLRVCNRYLTERYEYVQFSLDGQPCPDTGGVPVGVQGDLSVAEQCSTLIVFANVDADRFATPELIAMLKRMAARRAVIGSVDAGAILLARAGLLDGYRVSLHWEDAPAFHERFPRVEVTENIFEFDRDRFSCAGGTAGIDMILHVVRAAEGGVIAQRVSEHFLLERIRDGNTSQRSDIPVRFGVHHPKVTEAINLMEQQLEEPLAASKLAAAVKLSARQLLRLFRDQIGTTPAKLYLHLRLERARRLLRQSDLSVLDIAVACGFESASHFTRVYRQQFGHSPRSERRPGQAQLLVLDPPARSPTAPTRRPAPKRRRDCHSNHH